VDKTRTKPRAPSLFSARERQNRFVRAPEDLNGFVPSAEPAKIIIN
jgi:hypothetical protein